MHVRYPCLIFVQAKQTGMPVWTASGKKLFLGYKLPTYCYLLVKKKTEKALPGLFYKSNDSILERPVLKSSSQRPHPTPHCRSGFPHRNLEVGEHIQLWHGHLYSGGSRGTLFSKGATVRFMIPERRTHGHHSVCLPQNFTVSLVSPPSISFLEKSCHLKA